MYSGTAGYGPYYQIRIIIPDNHLLLRLPIGFPLLIELERSQDTSWVRISPALSQDEIEDLLK
jgi:hypothetical protein